MFVVKFINFLNQNAIIMFFNVKILKKNTSALMIKNTKLQFIVAFVVIKTNDFIVENFETETKRFINVFIVNTK